MAEERLHKVMAAAGFGSRRTCEQMIVDGKVQINGRTVTEVGVKVDPTQVEIVVDGTPLRVPDRHVYIKMNKPRNVVSDIGGDTGDHTSVADLLPDEMQRVFAVGRLDLNSEGLILLTDDGELAHRLTHPSFEHPKTYYALIEGIPPTQVLEQLRAGIDLGEGERTAPARIKVVDGLPQEVQLNRGPTEGVWLEVILHEGKKRQIRRMLATVGFPVLRLVRWSIGPLTLGKVRAGEWTAMKTSEVNVLRKFVELPPVQGVAEGPPLEGRSQRTEGRGRKAAAAGAVAAGTAASRGRKSEDRGRRTDGGRRTSEGGGRSGGRPRPDEDRPRSSRPRSDGGASGTRSYSSSRPSGEGRKTEYGRQRTESGGRSAGRPRSDDDRPRSSRPRTEGGASGTRSYSTRPSGEGRKAEGGRQRTEGGSRSAGRPRSDDDRPRSSRPRSEGGASGTRSYSSRPSDGSRKAEGGRQRTEGGSRSAGRPRSDDDRPRSSRPRSEGGASGTRSYSSRPSGAGRRTEGGSQRTEGGSRSGGRPRSDEDRPRSSRPRSEGGATRRSSGSGEGGGRSSSSRSGTNRSGGGRSAPRAGGTRRTEDEG